MDTDEPSSDSPSSQDTDSATSLTDPLDDISPDHPLFEEIRSTVTHFANVDAYSPSDRKGHSGAKWERLSKQTDMDLFVLPHSDRVPWPHVDADILTASMLVPGVTAKEICRYFWDVDFRLETDHTVVQAPSVLATPGQRTLLLHQQHKRVWPALARDSVFWSHLTPTGPNRWLVVNRSTDFEAPPVDAKKRVRITLCVGLLCEDTVELQTSSEDGGRSALVCRMRYRAQINPGGSVRPGMLRPFQQREMPVFMRRFSAFVIAQTKEQPVDV